MEALLNRDRLVVVTALVIVITASWSYVLLGAGMGMNAVDMTAMSGAPTDMMAGMAAAPAPWTLGYAVLMFLMWWVMMVAMMLPSAAPVIILFGRINRKERAQGKPFVATTTFALGYLFAWAAFSLLAVLLQWSLQRADLLSPMMAISNAILGSALLIAAGLYQLSPLKQACLRHCRSPVWFLSQHWRHGDVGALKMGAEHGLYCLGCCWVLMALLFYGGVMNLYWIIGLAGFVMLEKLAPAGHWVGRFSGLVLIVWGAALLLAATG